MFKVIYLDAEGTFLRFNPSLGEIYRKLWSDFGIQIKDDELSKKMRDAVKKVFKERLKDQEVNGNICQQGWREVFELVFPEFKNLPFFNKVFSKAYQFFASSECVKVDPNFYGFFSEVKSLGISLAIISNWDCRLYSVLEGHNLLHKFDAIFLGCEQGYLKPNPKLYLKALSYFKIKPNEGIMIGDSWEDDIEPAKKLGMSYFHVKDRFPTFSELKNFFMNLCFSL